MKKRKFLGFWLLITLVMALGIGAVGAITLSHRSESATQNDSTVQEESTSESNSSDVEAVGAENDTQAANPKGYLSKQRKHDIDLNILGDVVGKYIEESGEYWLTILVDHDDDGPYLSLCEGENCNPCFEGRIMYLKNNPDKSIEGYLVIVEVDKELYQKMPEGWSLESDGKYAILDINITSEGLKAGYRGSELNFLIE